MKNYNEEQNKDEILKLRKAIKELPRFVSLYFRGISNSTSMTTRLGYAYDLKIFFNYLITEEPIFSIDKIQDFTIDDFKKITVYHLEEFLEYLSYYTKEKEGKTFEYTNSNKGKNRKLSAIRSLFFYFYKKGEIDRNPSELVDLPKIKEKNITFLDVHEVANLLDEIENGDQLTKKQKDMHRKTKERDLALVALMLGTGMRISECVGVDTNDFNFTNNSVRIIRKGGNESILYFNQEIANILIKYKNHREKLDAKEGYEDAFFLSLQNKRITQRAVQNLVKKYAQIITPLKNISPHKLRSTYGTTLYRETGDIYLVADALGHKDVNTTKKHYARMDEERRKEAAKYINLR